MQKRWITALAGALALAGWMSLLSGCGGSPSSPAAPAASGSAGGAVASGPVKTNVQSPQDQARYNQDMSQKYRPPGR